MDTTMKKSRKGKLMGRSGGKDQLTYWLKDTSEVMNTRKP